MVALILFALLTTLATGVGAIPVFFLGGRASVWQPALWGLAAGVMSVAAIRGLLVPAFQEGSTSEVLVGLAVGIAFLAVIRALVERRGVQVGELSGADVRTSVLVFIVLFVHSLPEGLAIGTAYASEVAGLSTFVIVGIALQNIPEGTSVAIPMSEAGFSRPRQFWAAVLTSAPQPVGAVIAFLAVEAVDGLLPISFAFAAGAMLALIVTDLLPRTFRARGLRGPAGALAGAAAMVVFSLILGV